MKKVLTLILILVITLSNTIALSAQSKTNNPKIDSKQAIEIAKESFNLDTKGYDFNQNYSENQDDLRQWRLNWNSREMNQHINISVDADTGDIISMNRWKEDYNNPSKLSKYKREEALKVAEEIIYKLQPKKSKEIKLFVPVEEYNYDSYNFQFIRQVNNIPFQGNGINISIDKNTLELKNYNFTWYRGQMPNSINAISLEKAKETFNNKSKLELSYIIKHDKKTQDKALLIYNLRNGNRPIDAISNEPIDYHFYGITEGMAGGDMDFVTKQALNLTPEEIKKTEDIAGYITKEKALNIAEGLSITNKKQKLNHASLYSYNDGESANWTFSWEYNDNESKEYSYSNITIDAISGEVLNFYKNDSSFNKEQKGKPKYNETQSMKVAEEFLKDIALNKYKQTEYREDELKDKDQAEIRTYQFNFIRKINDIPCPSNSLRVIVNANTNDITEYYSNWNDIEFPKPENTISRETALNKLYENQDFNLQYILHYDYTLKSPNNRTVKLVYAFDNFSGMLDPKTGDVLDYSGEIIKDKDNGVFEDIEGHWAKSYILDLIDADIINVNSKHFYPDNTIKQKDFVKILINSIQPYYSIIPIAKDEDSKNEEYQEFYKQALAKKILTEKEKNMDADVKRIEAAKMIINALELGYIGNKPEMFKQDYKDIDSIPDDLKGYSALITGLDIMSDNNKFFLPDNKLTRGEAASVIVKFLKVERY